MILSAKQKDVLTWIVIGVAVSLVVLTGCVMINPFRYYDDMSLESRLAVLSSSILVISFFLCISIGRLAKYRLFNPDDIDGSTLAGGSDRARMLQAMLQNTLEQTVLAILVYSFWVFEMHSSWLTAVPASALLFCVGRMLFFLGYHRGTAARSLGFCLTFYPTVILLFFSLIQLALKLF